MRRIGPFLQRELALLAAQRGQPEVEGGCGDESLALDGSVVISPGPSGRGGRLHLALRLADRAVVGARVSTTSVGEIFRRLTWSTGRLVLADRGYANPPGLAHLVAQGADAIVRVNRGSLPLEDDTGASLDLLRWTRALRGSGSHARAVTVGHGDTALPCPLIAKRVPADELERARRRARRELGDDPRALAAALELAEWLVRAREPGTP